MPFLRSVAASRGGGWTATYLASRTPTAKPPAPPMGDQPF